MKAEDLKKEYVREEMSDDVGVIGILDSGYWYHIHDDEEVPEDEEVTVALHPRRVGDSE